MGKFKKETDELTKKLNEMLTSIDDISKKAKNSKDIEAVRKDISSVSDNLHQLIKIKDNADGVVIFCGLGSLSTASALAGAWIHSKPAFYIGGIGTMVCGYYLIDNIMQLRDRTGTLNIIKVYKKTDDDIQKIRDDIITLQNNIIDIKQEWRNHGDAAESRLQDAEEFLSSLGTDGLSDIINDEDTEAAQEIINKVKSFEDENRDDEFLIDDDSDDDSDDESDDSAEDTLTPEKDAEIDSDTPAPDKDVDADTVEPETVVE